jgi:uncharacterized membrane protein
MPENHFLKTDKARIVAAIREAEKNTSGEIRVHIESYCPENVMDRAAHYFKTLKMHQTALRNGVLFYLAYKDRKFAILGDAGINARVPVGFWDDIKEEMLAMFRIGDFAGGLEKGILMAGQQLKTHFPYQKDDVNELSDEISFGQ